MSGELPELVFKPGHCPGCGEPARDVFECHGNCGRPVCIACAPIPRLKCAGCGPVGHPHTQSTKP